MTRTSVIVPVYNVAAYLPACLDSLLAQTDPDFEIVAVNDGSTDGSADILFQYADRDKRVRIISKRNGGLSDARNAGIAQARGRYIACVDSDDLVREDFLASLVKQLEETGSQIAVSDMEYFYEDGHTSASSGGDFTVSDVRRNPQLIAINNSACNKLYQKELFAGLQFPVGRYYEDLALIPILLYRAERVCKVPAPLYRYRQRSGSIAHTASPKIFDIYDAIDDVVDYVRSHGNEPAVLTELYHLYIVHGLDLTTLRIRDFDDRSLRASYLRQNMARLRQSYPDFEKDSACRKAPFRKKILFHLLKEDKMEQVLKIYDR